ncbi:MAG TPA: hypothetical protein DHW82_00520 [Spirochaetia bacterium]|nr:MAG: hypothetical protein A2Y41_05320 [Spirochaetes bacterium GWB1_36_13]HCL55483.1 hypothetical protein [Spirochaetia bacterium]
MDYKIFLNESFSNVKDIETFIKKNIPDIQNSSFQWEFIEETGIALFRSSFSGIIYLSMMNGTKLNPFSYRKLNQAVLVSYDLRNSEQYLTLYYRLLRKMKKNINRLLILGIENEEDLKKEMDSLLLASSYDYHFEEYYEFYFYTADSAYKDLFLTVCLENHVKNFKYSFLFPLEKEEYLLKELVEEETYLFSGELEKKRIPQFIGALMEEGIDISKLTFNKIFKIL